MGPCFNPAGDLNFAKVFGFRKIWQDFYEVFLIFSRKFANAK
jgi:hypothetical protein